MEKINLPITRFAFNECELFGAAKELSKKKLPTFADVMRACNYERQRSNLLSNSKKQVSFTIVSQSVAAQIELIYKTASIPIVSRQRLIQKIEKYHDEYYSLKKSFKRDKNKPKFQSKVAIFKEEANKNLFDCAYCKCTMSYNCSCAKPFHVCSCPIIMQCTCEKDPPNRKKIPV